MPKVAAKRAAGGIHFIKFAERGPWQNVAGFDSFCVASDLLAVAGECDELYVVDYARPGKKFDDL